jgi:hypothetical protein
VTQSLVQSSAVGKFSGTGSISLSLAGVTANNDIIVQVTCQPGASVTISVSDGGGSYTLDADGTFSNNHNAIYRFKQASAGTHSITVSLSSSTAFGQAMASEVAGNSSNAVDKTSTNTATSTTPSVGPTSTLSSANEIVFVTLGNDESFSFAGITQPPTSGYTSIYFDNSNVEMSTDFAYKVVSSNAAVSANWGTLTNSQTWGAALAAYNSNNTPISPSIGAFNASGNAPALTSRANTVILPFTA